MKKAIIGKKVGMTQIFDEMGKVIPVTVIEAGPCVVTQKMTAEKEGYEAVQLGYEEVSEKHISKPEAGHLKKNGIGMLKHLKEFKLENAAELNVGDVLKADVFAAGDKVDVTGTSKGHGYAGVVKRETLRFPPQFRTGQQNRLPHSRYARQLWFRRYPRHRATRDKCIRRCAKAPLKIL